MRNFLKRSVTAVAGRFGYYVGVAPPTVDTLESYLRILFETVPIDLVLDVGAHHGEFVTEIRGAGYDGEAVSFEPVSDNYDRLMNKAAEDEAWRAFNVALGDKEGRENINVMQKDNLSSFSQPTEQGRNRLGAHMRIEREESVKMTTLDAIYRDIVVDGNERVVFLKVDTQGYDRRVFDGAMKVVEQCVVLQTELQFQRTYEGSELALDVLEWIEGMGYKVGGIFPVNYDRSMRLASADLIAIRA